MPIYEYRCSSCSHELEKLQRINEAPLTDCPECGKSALRRLISPAGFRLKGSGWYETDFKKDRKRNVAGSTSDGDAKKDESKSSDNGKADKATSSDSGGKSQNEKSGDSKSSDPKSSDPKSSDPKSSDKGSKASAE